MQKQIQIMPYLLDFHVNMIRACSTVKCMCRKGLEAVIYPQLQDLERAIITE